MGVAAGLDDASGQATATGNAMHKDLEPQWNAKYGAFTFYFTFHRPVN